MYEYLIGVLILAVIWVIGFFTRKDLRKPMIWSGVTYIIIITIGFLVLKILSTFVDIGGQIVPDYWNPHTLFNLGRITGGYAIEDVLFMFIVAGIATFAYEFLFRKRIEFKKDDKHHIRALIIGSIAASIFAIVFKANLIYPLMIFGLAGAITLWIERKDLIKHSLLGSLTFVIIYFLSFLLFNTIFPNFINDVYNLQIGVSKCK